jgi:hypothetical protein
VSRRWQVSIVYEDDKVTEVLARTDTLGP